MLDRGISRRKFLGLTSAAAVTAATGMPVRSHAAATLRYGHMNSPTSITGKQAEWFADAVKKNTSGEVAIRVYPSSQLGKIKELASGVATGMVQISHNTAGALSSLYEPLAALDTPYLYRDVNHLMKVVDIDSPVMKSLNKNMIAQSGVRILYAFYFGTRQLTANDAYKSPADLEGIKIRAIPAPIYLAAVEGLGAVPVPVPWSQVPTALATGVVDGQENPVNVVLDNKLYDVQSHMMLTSHIRAAELVIINESVWQSFSSATQDGINKAARTARQRATQAMLGSESKDLQALADNGMQIIGPDNGLDLAAFKASVKKRIDREFGDKYGDLYRQIAAIS